MCLPAAGSAAVWAWSDPVRATSRLEAISWREFMDFNLFIGLAVVRTCVGDHVFTDDA